MSTQPKKRGRKKGDPDGQIEAALQDGLSEDKSGINSKPVHRELVDSSKQQYAAMMEMWRAYVRRFPGSDPCSMEDMKHFAEIIARATLGRLDKKLRKPTVKSIRNKMRKFMSAWERDTSLAIPKYIHDSMCPYKDLLCMIGWKDREPEIKISFERDFAKDRNIHSMRG